MPDARETNISIFVLTAGCTEETTSLLQRAATTGAEPPVVYRVADLGSAHMWASLHRPDITIVDFLPFGGAAPRFLRRFRADPTCADIPVLALVDEQRREDRAAAILAGATDVILSPLDPHECRVRVLNLLTLGAQRQMLRDRARDDPRGVATLERQREWARELLLCFARARAYRSEAVAGRIGRTGRLSRGIARRLGLPPSQCDVIEIAAPMHDIGKIAIADALLRKRGPYTREERRRMEQHTLIGYELLKGSTSPYLQCGAEIALAHHEKFGGGGYPYGLAGEGIPVAARIVAVVDVFEALSSDRPHQPRWTADQVIRHLDAQRGRHFDPACVEALFAELAESPAL